MLETQELATIKKPNEIVTYSSKEEFEEAIRAIAHSKRDIVWWAEHFFRIVSLNTGLSLIKLYDKQKEMLHHLVNHDRNIILSSRQTGKTTTYTIFVMWYATLFCEKKIMVCSNKLQTSIEIMDRLRLSYEYLPKFIKPGIVVYNKQEITFSNKSTIRAFATSSSASRGFSAQCVDGNTKVKIRLFKFLELSVPVKWLRFLCHNAPLIHEEGDTLIVNVD